MMNGVICPDDETLHRLAAGDTPAPESDRLAAHLQSCETCADVFDGLVDSVVVLLRTPGESPPDNAEVDAAAARAKALLFVERTTAPAGPPPAEETGSYPPPAPTRLGKFDILAELGHGGMGTVFRGRDTVLHRDVAVKVIRPADGKPLTDALRARFLREARAVAKLRHDNVVPVFDVGDENGTPFLVMPLLPGETLAAMLKRAGKLPPAEVVRLGAQIADGLAAAHAAGLVHRDVKPSNVWVEPRLGGWVQLLDFGLVKPLEAADDSLTASFALAGTPPYMSPEQADAGDTDARSDLFSLGTVLYEMATGTPLFANAPGRPAVLAQVRNFPPPAAKTLLPGVPPDLAAVIANLLQPAPADRIQTAEETARRLREVRPVRPPRFPRKRIAVALALAAVVLLAAFQVVIRIKKDEADPGITYDVPPRTHVTIDAKGNPTFTMPPNPAAVPAPAPPIPPGEFLESAAYLPFDPSVKRTVYDFLEVHDKTPAEVEAWGAKLPAGYVPITLGRHAATARPPRVHAVAVRLSGDLLGVVIKTAESNANPIPGNWSIDSVWWEMPPPAEWAAVHISARYNSSRYAADWGVGKTAETAAEMRAVNHRPNALAMYDWGGVPFISSRWLPDGGRNKWVVKLACTSDELAAFADECRLAKLYVAVVSAYLDEKKELRFAAAALENADGRDWSFQKDMPAAKYETETAARKADGFYPVAVTSYGDANAPLYAAAWVRYRPAPVPPGEFLESAPYLPFDPTVKRQVTDYLEVHDKTPAEVEAWGAKLPPGYVPITLGRHAAVAGPPRVHAVAVRASPDAPGVVIKTAESTAHPIPGNWPINTLWTETATQAGWAAVHISTPDKSARFFWDTANGDFPAKAEEMRAKAFRPNGVAPYVWGGKDFFVSAWVPDGGRNKWVVKPALTADELDAFVADCVRTNRYVGVVSAYLDEKKELRFAAAGLENADGRDWDFARDLPAGDFETQLAAHKADGFYPVAVTSYEDANAPLYAAAWVRYRPRPKTPSDGLAWHELAVPLPTVATPPPLESSAYLPFAEETKREITDFSVILDAPPEAVLRWANTLPGDVVPTTLGAYAPARTPRLHAVAYKLTNNPPKSRAVYSRDRYPGFRYEFGEGEPVRDSAKVLLDPTGGEHHWLYFICRDALDPWLYGYDAPADFPAVVKAMREVRKCKPFVLWPNQLGADVTVHQFMPDYGRNKWRLKTDVPRGKLQSVADDCARQNLFVKLVTAHVDAAGTPRFGVIAWENPDGRDVAFRTEMTKPEFLKELADRKTRGFCPTTITSFGDPENPRYAASWVRYFMPK